MVFCFQNVQDIQNIQNLQTKKEPWNGFVRFTAQNESTSLSGGYGDGLSP